MGNSKGRNRPNSLISHSTGTCDLIIPILDAVGACDFVEQRDTKSGKYQDNSRGDTNHGPAPASFAGGEQAVADDCNGEQSGCNDRDSRIGSQQGISNAGILLNTGSSF